MLADLIFEVIFEFIAEVITIPFRLAWREFPPSVSGAEQLDTSTDPLLSTTGEEMRPSAKPSQGEATSLWDRELDG
ncbi:hypothetical protein V5E97_11090 [Singulisphaera sp. Ch08]|uniref:Uncharacterized protein n=1 Tax=Singulisphaera sp. Ch08 TaxID=3120278 RepID=A0AAU7CNH0_9BACT